MFNIEIFSQRVFSLRKLNNLTQVQLAEQIGVSKGAINNIEKANRSASIEVICALADFFNVSVDFLIGMTDNPAIHK